MTTRGIRGANSCLENSADGILAATRELLTEILAANPGLDSEDMGSIFFTTTGDLDAIHPAHAARQLGWTQVPLMCSKEIDVPNSLPQIIRVLIQWNTDHPQAEIRHIYLGEARALRPDLALAHGNPHPERLSTP